MLGVEPLFITDELLLVLMKNLRRAMHPLTHRRKGAIPDIRPEEFTPSYAGSSTRMDFLLPKHKVVLELKFVRDRTHAKKIGDELIVDIDHYQRHPDCNHLWCVVFDQGHLLPNVEGLKTDLEGQR